MYRQNLRSPTLRIRYLEIGSTCRLELGHEPLLARSRSPSLLATLKFHRIGCSDYSCFRAELASLARFRFASVMPNHDERFGFPELF
jgi:hypothetical protein